VDHVGVVRTIVFPALRLLVWALIAIALLYIAFGRGRPESAGAASPSAVLTPAETTVARGDVVNTVSLTGTIEADAATTVKATAAGTVGRVRASVGDAVEKGTPLFTVLVPVEETTPATTAADPAAPVAAPAAPRTRTVTVTATVPGTLATLDVLPAQPVSIGDAVATVSPGTLTVSAPLTQDQQFRLLAPPTSASVTVPGGPGTFACTGLRTGVPGSTPAPAAVPDPYGYGGGATDPGSTPTGATVTCRVPPEVQVFSGLSATVEVTAGRAAGVLLAPVTAVQGRVAQGSVWVLDDAGAPTRTAVTLGLTDGEHVEVRGGVAEGARILQFVPGTDDAAQNPDGSPVVVG